MRIGNTMAAALTGEETSDIIGIASELKPENPPFDRPRRITAGIATRKNCASPDIRSLPRAARRSPPSAVSPAGVAFRRAGRDNLRATTKRRSFGGVGSEMTTSGYRQTYDRWRADPQGFWAEAAPEIAWTKPPQRIFDAQAGVYGRWFPDARCNACFNALDRHVEAGRGDQVALYYDSPVTGTKRAITYRELLDETATLGAALDDLGVSAGDRVLIYMPMIPEAIVAMLACARIGAVHSVVFGGFAAKELATRIDDAELRVILTASCGLEPGRIVEYKPLLDLAIALARHKPS